MGAVVIVGVGVGVVAVVVVEDVCSSTTAIISTPTRIHCISASSEVASVVVVQLRRVLVGLRTCVLPKVVLDCRLLTFPRNLLGNISVQAFSLILVAESSRGKWSYKVFSK